MELNRSTMKKLMLLIAFGIVLCLGLLNLFRLPGLVRFLLNILEPVIFGFVVAYVFNLLMRQLEWHAFAPLNRRFGTFWPRARRAVSILLSLAIIFGALALIVLIIVPDLVSSVSALTSQLPALLERLQKNYRALLDQYPLLRRQFSTLHINWDSLNALFSQYASQFSSNALGFTLSVTTNVFNAVVSFILGFVIAINILYEKETLKRQLHKLLAAYLPGRTARKTVRLLRMSNRAFSDFITGQCLGAVILALLCFVGMKIFRFPFALLISVLVGVLSLVPILGQILSVLLGALLILMESPVQSLWFIVYLLVLQQLNGNLIYPKIVGSKIGLPTLWVLIAITVGGNLFGIAGMLVSIPIFSVLHTLVQEDVARRLRRRHEETAPQTAAGQPGKPPAR